jgi:hypothetical protein
MHCWIQHLIKPRMHELTETLINPLIDRAFNKAMNARMTSFAKNMYLFEVSPEVACGQTEVYFWHRND